MLRSSHVAVALVGGPTSLCRWTGAELIHELDVLTSSRGDGEMALVVMLSRRTPPETVQMILEWSRRVQHQRERHLHVQVIEVGSWGQGPNPYLAVRPLPAHFVFFYSICFRCCRSAPPRMLYTSLYQPGFRVCKKGMGLLHESDTGCIRCWA